MTDLKLFTDDVILNALFLAMDLGDKQEEMVRAEINKMVSTEIGLILLSYVSKEEAEELENKDLSDGYDELWDFFQEYINKHPDVEELIIDYFEHEYKDFIEGLMNTYLENATEEQRERFFQLTSLEK
jgi:hypothetical protein